MPSPWDSFRSVRDVRRIEDEYVEIDLGAGPRRLPRGQRHLDLRSAEHATVPADGPVDWSQLDRLPSCIAIDWSGPDRGLCAALAAHPAITSLRWDDADGVVELPESLLVLRLFAPRAGFMVGAPDLGYQMDLRLDRKSVV